MSGAKAGAFNIAPSAAKLLEPTPEPMPWSDADAIFGDGQISGPYGPQFAGYGKMTLRLHWLNWRGTVGVAAGIAALAFALMALK